MINHTLGRLFNTKKYIKKRIGEIIEYLESKTNQTI